MRAPGMANYASQQKQPIKLDPSAPDSIALARQESSGTQHAFGSTPGQRNNEDPEHYIPGYGRIAGAQAQPGLTAEAQWDKVFPNNSDRANTSARWWAQLNNSPARMNGPATPSSPQNTAGATGSAGVPNTSAPQPVQPTASLSAGIPTPMTHPAAPSTVAYTPWGHEAPLTGPGGNRASDAANLAQNMQTYAPRDTLPPSQAPQANEPLPTTNAGILAKYGTPGKNQNLTKMNPYA